MKKLLSVLLVLAMVGALLAFTGCEKAPEELLTAADEALTKGPYKMTLKTEFSSDDQTLQEVFDAMNLEIPVTIDGDNMAMDMSMDMEGMTMKAAVSLVEKTLYMSVDVSGMSVKMKTPMTDEDLKKFEGDSGASLPVEPSQFSELKAEKKDGKTVITCTGITDEGKKALNDQMAESAGTGATAEVGDLSFTVTLKNGKYDAMELSCDYSVTVAGKTYATTMKIAATYSYTDVPAVAAPSDAASYMEMKYSDLFP